MKNNKESGKGNPKARDVLERCHNINKEYNFFNVICDEQAIKQETEIEKKNKRGKLAGLYVSVKDCICVKDVESTAGSKILKGYKPLFDATVISRIKSEDAIIIGKTSQDAFGFGSFNVNVGLDYDIPKNPLDKDRATGGSSGGSAGITQVADFPHVSIAESTGGSIECPASFCGVIGFCPTYGRVSRYGLISYADSLDKIGLMGKRVDDIIPVLEVISGFDPMDATSLRDKLNLKTKNDKFRIGIVKESLKDIDPKIAKAFDATVKKLERAGMKPEEVTLPITHRYGIASYYIIATSESSTNLARFSGLRYGMTEKAQKKKFNDFFSEVRSKNFNEESKRRILLGTFARMAGYRDAYYIKSTKVRTKVIEEYKELFKKYDILISPTMPILPPRFSEINKLKPIEVYMMDVLTIGPNLAGIPHASIPIGESDGLSIGMMASADHLMEGKLLQFMKKLEVLQ